MEAGFTKRVQNCVIVLTILMKALKSIGNYEKITIRCSLLISSKKKQYDYECTMANVKRAIKFFFSSWLFITNSHRHDLKNFLGFPIIVAECISVVQTRNNEAKLLTYIRNNDLKNWVSWFHQKDTFIQIFVSNIRQFCLRSSYSEWSAYNRLRGSLSVDLWLVW
jgi:hypothetical protein